MSSRWTAFAVVVLLLGAGEPAFAHKDHHHPQAGAPSRDGAGKPPQDEAARKFLEASREITDETRWDADYFPNVLLTTHEGKQVRFFDLIKDKVVSINFMYASCPDSCPVETARLVQVQRILGDRVGRDVFMYSITIDPKNDTPEVLKEYVKKYQIGPGWLFLTGKEADITLLRRKLGVYQEAVEEGTADHSLSLVTGNQATGQWKKRSPFDNPYILAEQLGSWLHNWKYGAVTATRSYKDAPLRLRQLSAGEGLFRNSCAACHTIGGGDVRDVARGNVGPDLLGVTRKRDRGWLARWLANPEKMLADKDPLALELYAQFDNLIMPNFKLSERNINDLIEYMESESRRIELTPPTASN